MNRQKLIELLELNRDCRKNIDLDLHIFDTLPSTNQKLAELVADGAAPGTIVIARAQTAGRGQRGREWHSAMGGLYLSLALAPDLAATDAHQLTMGIAWGIADRLRHQHIPVSIKWPNDIMLKDRKLGGILTETRICRGKIQQAIVGVGINHSNQVEGHAINLAPSIDCQPNYRDFTIEMLASCTIEGIISGYQRCTPTTIDSLLSDYLKLLKTLGNSVMVNGKLGTVLGISPRGELHIGFTTTTKNNDIYLTPGTFTLGYET
jgi:BirA family transcriptional regulator, biotin operon repressor / biotin---[acetyl-CoA-carboxylase] ligase